MKIKKILNILVVSLLFFSNVNAEDRKSELDNLENCKHILWKKTDRGIKLNFLIGNEAEINPCILKYVQPDKLNILGSIANALPEILGAGLAKKPEQLDAIMVLLNDARQQEK